MTQHNKYLSKMYITFQINFLIIIIIFHMLSNIGSSSQLRTIAYVLTIVKNGQKGWDEKMKGNDPNEETLDSGTYIHVANVVF